MKNNSYYVNNLLPNKKTFIRVTLRQDIEIAEKGTPEPKRVKVKVVFNNMHHLFFEKKIKEKVNQVVTIILILLYESMLFTNPTRLPLVSLHTSLCVWLNVYCQPPDPMSHQSCHPSLDLLYKIAKFICLQHDITGIQEVLPRPQTKRLLRILTTHHFLAVTTHSLCAAHTTHFPDS